MLKISTIKPLTDFIRNSKAHIQALRTTREPAILAANGEAAIVVQDAASYEKMALLAEQAILDARLQSAMEYFREGEKELPLRMFSAALKKSIKAHEQCKNTPLYLHLRRKRIWEIWWLA